MEHTNMHGLNRCAAMFTNFRKLTFKWSCFIVQLGMDACWSLEITDVSNDSSQETLFTRYKHYFAQKKLSDVTQHEYNFDDVSHPERRQAKLRRRMCCCKQILIDFVRRERTYYPRISCSSIVFWPIIMASRQEERVVLYSQFSRFYKQ